MFPVEQIANKSVSSETTIVLANLGYGVEGKSVMK